MVCVLALWPSLISHINGLHCLLFKIWLDLPNGTDWKPPWKQAGQLTVQAGTDWKPTHFAVYLLCYLWSKTCHFLWTSVIGLAGKVTRFDGCSMKIKQFLWKHRWLFTQTAVACWWAHNDSLYLYFVSNKKKLNQGSIINF